MSAPGAGRPPGRLLFVAANPSVDRLYELDRLTLGEIHRPRSLVAVPGGKGLNAARAAAMLGGAVVAVGIVAGRAGDWIEEGLAGLGIDARTVRVAGETRTCVSILDRSTGGLTEIYERGTEIDPVAWDALEDLVRAELAHGDIAAVALSGSLPPGAPPEGHGRIVRIAHAATPRVPVLADTYGPPLAVVLAERPAVVKINAAEAGQASSIHVVDPVSAGRAAEVLLAAGAGCVVVTLGLEGAVVARAGEQTRLVPPDIRGDYPVGSGDAFLAGLAVALAVGETAIEAARAGLAAGIANALVPGAGILDPAGIDDIRRRITTVAL